MSEPLNLDLLARVIDLLDQSGFAPRSAMEPHSLLRSELGLDGIDLLQLSGIIRATFEVRVAICAPMQWNTIADIVRHIQALQVPA